MEPGDAAVAEGAGASTATASSSSSRSILPLKSTAPTLAAVGAPDGDPTTPGLPLELRDRRRLKKEELDFFSFAGGASPDELSLPERDRRSIMCDGRQATVPDDKSGHVGCHVTDDTCLWATTCVTA